MSPSVLTPSPVPAGPSPHPFPRHSQPLPPTLYLLSPSQLQGSIFVLILVWVCWVFVVDLEFTCRLAVEGWGTGAMRGGGGCGWGTSAVRGRGGGGWV
uniref:Transmembrane protein n=1 Tax=Fagus sylvatica TaxID=28930 RepID=A0A2N9IHG8_FAGSY